MAEPLLYRLATPTDLPAIDRLERACFEGPWSKTIYEEELRRETSTVELAVPTETPQSILGVSCSWIVAGECHLLRVLTDPARRREGTAAKLVQRIVERSRHAGCKVITLEVASLNFAAVRLYEHAGFVEVGRRAGYYKTPPDDAVLMTLEL